MSISDKDNINATELKQPTLMNVNQFIAYTRGCPTSVGPSTTYITIYCICNSLSCSIPTSQGIVKTVKAKFQPSSLIKCHQCKLYWFTEKSSKTAYSSSHCLKGQFSYTPRGVKDKENRTFYIVTITDVVLSTSTKMIGERFLFC